MSDPVYLWVTTSGSAPTGYGVETAMFLPRIRATDRKVALFAILGPYSAPYRTPEGVLVLPRGLHPMGSDVLRGHFDYTGASAVISLVDPHILDPAVYGEVPWCAWAPIDSEPLAPATAHSLRAARWIWAVSRFGERMLHNAGFENVTYVPHAVDTQVFFPRDRQTSRKVIGKVTGATIEDGHFLVVMNAANTSSPSRKGFYEAFAAFKNFSDRYIDARLYVHSEITGASWPMPGEDLRSVAALVGLSPDKVIFPPQYHLVCGMIDQGFLADVYSAADVFLSAAHGEGFGIPIVEAQACGCPVIVPDNSAQAELCLTGWQVAVRPYMPFVGATWGRPNVDWMVNMLEAAHTGRGDAALRTQARERVLGYDAERVFAEYMRPALERIERELEAKDTAR